MLRVYLRELQASGPLDSPWPVYVAEATGCHQQNWDPELSGAPPPAAATSCSQEPVPLIEFPDVEVEEINLC